MSEPTIETFGKFVVKILKVGGDYTNSNDYEKPCGFTSKGYDQTKSVNETEVPDCDDEDKAAQVRRSTKALSRSFSGNGVLAMEWRARYQSFYDAQDSVYCRIYIDDVLANAGGYWQGKFVLTTFNSSADKGDFIKVAIELQSDGDVPWIDADA
jgi:hypothetical protein